MNHSTALDRWAARVDTSLLSLEAGLRQSVGGGTRDTVGVEESLVET